ncbi:VWA domain-containing protein, partial [Halomonas sp. DP4Y7-1]|nr:VWA domain-containing protein [Halomonas sp. DP4Y7-2]MBY6234531.1 VWA domain-containing protein [Halomonas sp. DP4Y7-1]
AAPGLSMLQFEKQAIIRQLHMLKNLEATINVQLVDFDTGARQKTFMNFNSSNMSSALYFLNASTAKGGTNIDRGLQLATNYYKKVTAANNFENVSFLFSDGGPTLFMRNDGRVGFAFQDQPGHSVPMKNTVGQFKALSQLTDVHAIALRPGTKEGTKGNHYMDYLDNT